MDNVKVTLHLTPEAAAILHQYAGERGRGFFVSQLLLAVRRNDDLEGERLVSGAKRYKLIEMARAARDKYVTPASPLRG